MKIFMLLGWRNLWRHKRRSWVVISSVSLGLYCILLTIGFMNGMISQLVDNTIRTSLGHVAVHEKGYFDNMKIETNFAPDKKLFETIMKNPLTEAAAPRVKLQGMVRSSEGARGVLIMGIDPQKEKSVSGIYGYTLPDGKTKKKDDRYLADPDALEILISKSMAKTLDVVIGDKVVLMVQDDRNEIIGVALTVRGLYESPMESFDKFVVYVGITQIQKITGIGGNISEISVIAKNRDRAPQLKKKLAPLLPKSLELFSWQEMAPSIVGLIKMMDSQMVIFYVIIFVTIIFSIANTLIMAILERFHEIGVMKSIGTRPSQVFFMILFEAFNLGLVGLAVGLSVGIISIKIMGVTGIDLSAFMATMRAWGTGSVIYPIIKVKDIFIAIAVVLVTTGLAALYPAIKAARIKPLDALHYV